MSERGAQKASNEQQRVARESYNKLSPVYGFLSNSSEKKFVKVAIEQELEPKEGERILEPGFGAGQVLVALARMVGTEGKVYGIDVSDGMVKQAGKRLMKAGLSERAEIIRGDAADMPYEDGFFDAVFMSFTLELFPDEKISAVLGECMRVLKSVGRICVASMSKQGKHGAMMKIYAWSHEKLPAFVDCRPIYAGEAIEEAGFELEKQKVLSMWGLPVEIVLARKPDKS